MNYFFGISGCIYNYLESFSCDGKFHFYIKKSASASDIDMENCLDKQSYNDYY